MSKPKHKFRGKGRYVGYGYSTTDFAKRPPKGEFEYKDAISSEYNLAFRKTWHIELKPNRFGRFGKGKKIETHEPNAKRRLIVQKRLKKLRKYVRRAWAGYQYGVLPKKVLQ